MRLNHVVHATRVVRSLDYDDLVAPLKNQNDFDSGVTDIAGLSSALYRGPHIIDLDKIRKHPESDKPIDKEEPDDLAVQQVTDLSGFPCGDLEAVRAYRTNKAGRRVLIDATGSEIRKGSRRPIGRISTI